MTYLEIDKALIDIVMEKYNECQGRLNAIPKENKGERKAVQIELGMYALCNNAGHMYHTKGSREHILHIRQNILKQILQKYPVLNDAFCKLDGEELMRFIAALQAEIFMRDQVFHSYRAELAQAESAGDTAKIFEFKIKIGAIQNVFDAWEAWRVENDVYPHMLEEVS